MAYVSLKDALSRTGLPEADLKNLVKEQGVQVFMMGEGAERSICFEEADVAKLVSSLSPAEAPAAAATESLDLDVEGVESISLEDDVSSEEPQAPVAEPASEGDVDLALDLDDGAAPDESLSLDLDGDDDLGLDDSELDLDLDGGDSMSESLGLEGDETLAVEPISDDVSLDFEDDTLGDDTLDAGGDETLSFDDGDQTLSIDSDDDDLTLNYDEADNLKLADESFSIDGDSSVVDDLGLEDESGVLAIDEDADEEEEEAFRPTTEIVDEDNVNFFFPLLALLCFGVIVFNGCILFGLIQDIDLSGGISYGKNFFSGICEFAQSNFAPLK